MRQVLLHFRLTAKPPASPPACTARSPHASWVQAHNDGIVEVNPRTQKRLRQRDRTVPSSKYSDFASCALDDHHSEGFGVASASRNPSVLPEQGPDFIARLVTVDDASLTTRVTLPSGLAVAKSYQSIRSSSRHRVSAELVSPHRLGTH